MEPIEIERIDIRTVWPGEAKDFTPWLAENLDILSDHLELDAFDAVETEKRMPSGRSLDILAEDANGRKWAIENQYGVADHDHLTRVMAYAVGLDCSAAILVAEDHRPEFVAIVDEWNRYSEAYGQAGIRLFLAVIEAWRIGDSAPGFRFRQVAGPNEWIEAAGAGSREQSEADRARYAARRQFWTEVLDKFQTKSNLFDGISAGQSPYVSKAAGPFRWEMWSKATTARVQLSLNSNDGAENDELFGELLAHRESIEADLGATLIWDNADTKRLNRIYWEVPGACGYRTEGEDRAAGIESLIAAAIRFCERFDPLVEALL